MDGNEHHPADGSGKGRQNSNTINHQKLHQSTNVSKREQPVSSELAADQVATSPLDRLIIVTSFPTLTAQDKTQHNLSLKMLELTIKSHEAASKAGLPWYKMATFGNTRTDKGCLRNDTNVLIVTGVECDYDDGEISPQEAVAWLEKAGVASLVYTTPSHTTDKPRWRVMAPLFNQMQGQELKMRRAALVARLNGLFNGSLDGASFNLSQSFYAGNVMGNPPIETFLIEGQRFIDQAGDLDKTALGKAKKRVEVKRKDGSATKVIPKKDDSGSGYGWRFLLKCCRNGMTEEQAEQAISEDDGPAGNWYRTADNMKHQFSNTWRNANGAVKAQIDAMLESLNIEPEEQMLKKLSDLPAGVSENGAALLFAILFEDQYRYDQTRSCWFRWKDHRWTMDVHASVRNEIRKICEAIAYRDPENPKIAMLKANAMAGTERLARCLPGLSTISKEWDRDVWLLGTPGGVVDLNTGKLIPGRREDRITKATLVTPIPREIFDPAEHCPTWMKFLDDATGADKELILFLQCWFGYNLTGLTREHALLFVHGPGGTGKSTVINVIGDLLGEYCVNVEAETLTESQFERHTTELARLAGSRMARVSEVKIGKNWDQKRIVALTGGDKLTARYMRQDNFEFTPQFKLTIVGISRPGFAQMDSAIERRMTVVPFNKKPDKPDKGLSEKLMSEGPGIMAWLIEGCLLWQKHGLVRPKVVKDYTQEYTREQDVFAQWIKDSCEVGKKISDTSGNLWESWCDFTLKTGEKPGNKRGEFADRMREHGLQSDTHCGPNRTQRGFKGIQVKDESISPTVVATTNRKP